ncbi:MAG: D-aminoacylase [Nitrospiraceae bacterium]|nr:MAG: D-aminoacylase [Nitrospiraceae bacterium]
MKVDYLIKGGLVLDGSSADAVPVSSDIAIAEERIHAVGNLEGIKAKHTINAGGLCVCPGFIDTHAHSDFMLLADPRAEGKFYQGVTTEINGNCGLSAAPLQGEAMKQREREIDELGIQERWSTFAEYFAILKNRKPAINVATLLGQGNLRASIAGYSDKLLSEQDRKKMTELIHEAMQSGVKGISTGLIYPPGTFSTSDELTELASVVAAHGGIYTTHMRSEGDELIASVKEVLNLAEDSGINVHISHLKTSGRNNWNKLDAVFQLIDDAHDRGLSVTCDRYPYIASSTDLDAMLPAWAFEGGRAKELLRLRNERAHLKEDIERSHSGGPEWESILISSVSSDSNRWMEGKRFPEIYSSLGKDPFTCLFDLLAEEELRVGAIFFTMSEDNLKAIMKKPYTMIGSDSSARSFDGITAEGVPHPRGFGSFPRVLGRYVREEKTIPLGEAIYKMTGLPARVFKLEGRGMIRQGAYADIVVFDRSAIEDRAEFNKPFQKPDGIHSVFVNGVPVLSDGRSTGARPGRVLS